MPRSMTRLTIRVPAELARNVRAHVVPRGLSAFVVDAMRHALENEQPRSYLDALDAKLGLPPVGTITHVKRAR